MAEFPMPTREEWERGLKEIYSRTGSKTTLELLFHFRNGGTPDNIPISLWGKYDEDLREAFTPQLYELFLDRARNQIAQTGIDFVWDQANEAAAAWAEQYTYELVKDISRTDERLLQLSFRQYWHDGLNQGQVRELIEMSPAFGPARAELIAITEVTRTAVEAELRAVEELRYRGFTLISVWQTNHDEIVCGTCGPYHNQPQGDEWHEPPPAHPGCRCWLDHVMDKGSIEEIPPTHPVIEIDPDLGNLDDAVEITGIPSPDRAREMGFRKYYNSIYPKTDVHLGGQWRNYGEYARGEFTDLTAKQVFNLRSKGIPEAWMPKDLRIGFAEDFNSPWTFGAGGWCDMVEQIAINYEVDFWKVGGLYDQAVKAGTVATRDVLAHEVGHNAHFNFFKQVFGQFPGRSSVNLELKANIAKDVSQYATSNTREFVAETFAGLVNDIKYPNYVLEYYKELGGPPVPGILEYNPTHQRLAVEAFD